MLFNSFDFLIFICIVYCIYWTVQKYNVKFQNIIVLIASYIFYGWWDWRFISLIFFSTVVDYYLGLSIKRNAQFSKTYLGLSIVINLGLLGVFKYYNFFVSSWVSAWEQLDVSFNETSLNLILPVGISFYTFQTLSYTIDVYRDKLEPTKDFVSFASFVSFFPQLVAGPIERATNLLPQFFEKRRFCLNESVKGVSQILWGLLKKVVIADNCAPFVNEIFSTYHTQSSVVLIFGAVLFAFQIYGDFSGYSDIAIGLSRLLGFKLMTNFRYPYFSRDIAEFWRRWHISLSTWFRDYLYIPLGGSRGSSFTRIRNVIIIFLVSGMWHGANWTFLFWGFLNALFILPLIIGKSNRLNIGIVAQNTFLPNLKEFIQILLTFLLTCLAWVFFRVDSIHGGFDYIHRIFCFLEGNSNVININIIALVLAFVLIEWFYRKTEIPLFSNNMKISFINSSVVIVFIILFGNLNGGSSFIYFQF